MTIINNIDDAVNSSMNKCKSKKGITITSASTSLGFSRSWLGRVISRKGKSYQQLINMGFSGNVTVERIETIGGFQNAELISESDFDILTCFAATQGKRSAIISLAKNEKIGNVLKIESRKKSRRGINQEEKKIQKILSESLLGSKTEVVTPSGKIDVLSQSQIIEVKEWRNWKGAIGQVLCYGKHYPQHEKRIHFFGSKNPELVALVVSHCQDFGIIITWEEETVF